MPRFLQAVVILVAAALAAPALAQAYSVPAQLQGVVSRQNLDQAATQAVSDYVAPLVRDLRGGEPAAISIAREDLIAPLVASDDISVSFRLTYADALMPTLQALVGGDEVGAIAAIRIAGELGTGQSVDLLIDALDAESPGVRYAGAQALGATLRLIAEGNPAVQAERATGVIEVLSDLIEAESDPLVVDAGVRALDAVRNSAPLRQAAIEAAALAMIEQIRVRRDRVAADANATEPAASMLRAIVAARGFFIAVGAGVPEPTAESVLLMTGHAMAYGVRLIEDRSGWAGLSADEDETVSSMLIAAEAVGGLSYLSLTGQQVNEQPILRAVENEDLNTLRNAVNGWVGPNGRICRPPVNADPNDFD